MSNAGKKKQKTAMMKDMIEPHLKDWLKHVQLELSRRLWNLSNAKFSETFHDAWRYTEHEVWTLKKIRETALKLQKYQTMSSDWLAKLIFNLEGNLSFHERGMQYGLA